MTTTERDLRNRLHDWRVREHHDHALFTRDQGHVRGILRELQQRARPRPVRGIDISEYQSADLRAVRAGGVGFVICKATEGLGWTDPTFAERMGAARGAGLIRGAYHFARPQAGRSGAQEAAFFLEHARLHLQTGDLFPCLDIETTTLDRAGTIGYVRSFTDHVHAATGWQTILYTYPAFLTWPPMPNPLWIAGPGDSRPPQLAGFRPPVIWQTSFTGHVRGINGAVDLDITDTRTLRTITIGATA